MSDIQTAIVAAPESDFMPAMTIQQAIQRRGALVDFVKAVMVKDSDFGVIPGTGTKPTLLKPGAEKLCTLFGLSSTFVLVASDIDHTGEKHAGEPYIYYQYRCDLSRNGRPIASGIGSCNSWEKKYRYRESQRVCPVCGKPAIIKGKAEYGGGWLCFAKRGGCGAKFADTDQAITGQQVGQIINPDVFDAMNTIDKMAQKRALVAATLLAVNASEFFTQDIEDMAGMGGDVIDVEPRHVPQAKPQPRRQDAPMPQADAIPPAEPHDAPPEYLAPPDTATGARQRLAKHAKAVQTLMDAEQDVAHAAELSAAISTARAVYADRNATIGDLHRAADTLKALHEPATEPTQPEVQS